MGLCCLQPIGRKIDGFLPTDFAPGIGDGIADHRLGDAVGVGGIAKGEAALDAAMPVIGLAILVGHHAHDLVAFKLRLERAADPAIGAGGQHRAVGHAKIDNAFFLQRRGGAGLHTGTA